VQSAASYAAHRSPGQVFAASANTKAAASIAFRAANIVHHF
jgi:hypothetical protein